MKNKIPLSTVPFLSALMGAAFGKGENKTVEEILNEGFDKSLVENIVRRMNRSEYKRRMPLIAKIKR